MNQQYPALKGRDGREYQNGAICDKDKFMHLSVDMGHTTICGNIPDKFLITYSDVEITCPECVKILKAKVNPPHLEGE